MIEMAKVSRKLSKVSNRQWSLGDILWPKITNRKIKSRLVTNATKLFIPDKTDTPNGSKFKESWTKFCDNSTLDGLYLIGGTRKAPYIKISAFMFLTSILLAGYLCYGNLNLYLDLKLQTTISYYTNTALSFPALTFCSVNMFKRSVVGIDEVFTRTFTTAYARNEAEQPIIWKEVNNKFIMHSTANDIMVTYIYRIEFVEYEFRLNEHFLLAFAVKQRSLTSLFDNRGAQNHNFPETPTNPPTQFSCCYKYDFSFHIFKNKVTCRAYNGSKTEFLRYMQMLYKFKSDYDMKPICETFGQIAKDMVKKCWWNKNEIDCNKQFMNHFLDFTNCFTFNQNSSDLDPTGSVAPVFGMEGISYTPRMVSNPQQGLKLLLDTQQQEYCGSPVLRSGAGFRLLIHDTHAQTSLKLLPAILLSPGFEYTVTMQPVTYDMRNFSESLGRCVSNVYNPMRPKSDYNQPSCFLECYALKMWKYCKCVPIQTRLITDALIKYAGETRSSTRMRMCDPLEANDFFCGMDIDSQFKSSTPNEFCPGCIQKCFETKYEYKLSVKRLSRSQEIDNGTNGSQRDLVMVTFNFNSMTSMRIMETQLFTLIDLFIYWGNTLGLFLGFSFVTLYEVFHQLIYSLQVLTMQKYRSLKCIMGMFKVFRRGDKVQVINRNHQTSKLFL